MAASAILKNKKRDLGNGLTDQHNVWHDKLITHNGRPNRTSS